MAMVKLSSVAREVRGSWKWDRKDVPVVGLEHLEPDEIWLRQWDVNPSENTFTKAFKKGQLLFGRRRAYQKKLSLAPCDGICSGDITVIEAIPGEIEPRLLPFILRTDQFFDFAIRGSGGSLSPRVKWVHIADYEFDLPPIEKQRELAELLWAANDLKESYKKMIVATDEMLKAKFREMFEEGECDKVSLMDVCRPRQWPTIATKDFTESGYPVYGANGQIGRYMEYNHEKPTVMIACRGASCGAVNVSVPMSYINGNAMALDDLDEKRYDFDFFAYLLSHYDFSCIIGGSAQPQITREGLAQVLIKKPPLALQQEFVEIARKADESKAALKKSIADIDNVIKGLING